MILKAYMLLLIFSNKYFTDQVVMLLLKNTVLHVITLFCAFLFLLFSFLMTVLLR